MTWSRELPARCSNTISSTMRPGCRNGRRIGSGCVALIARSRVRLCLVSALLSTSLLLAPPLSAYEPRQPRSDLDAGLLSAPCGRALSPQQWQRGHDLRGDLVRLLHEALGGVRDLLGCPAVRDRRRSLPKAMGL